MVGHSTEFHTVLGHKRAAPPTSPARPDLHRQRTRPEPCPPRPGDFFPPLAISRIITPRIARLAFPHLSRKTTHRVIEQPMNQSDAWSMIRRRRPPPAFTRRSAIIRFRQTGITTYLSNGGALEHAQEMAAHESPRSTKLYDARRSGSRRTRWRGSGFNLGNL